jgi:hypothetical protein
MSARYKITKDSDGFYNVWMRDSYTSEYVFMWAYGDCERAIAFCERLIDPFQGETIAVDLRGVAHA